MWTLVIITLIASDLGGGVSTTTTFLDFADKPKCDAAATAIGVGSDTIGSGTRPLYAFYRIVGKCVQH
jgi:hypothetical protein